MLYLNDSATSFNSYTRTSNTCRLINPGPKRQPPANAMYECVCVCVCVCVGGCAGGSRRSMTPPCCPVVRPKPCTDFEGSQVLQTNNDTQNIALRIVTAPEVVPDRAPIGCQLFLDNHHDSPSSACRSCAALALSAPRCFCLARDAAEF